MFEAYIMASDVGLTIKGGVKALEGLPKWKKGPKDVNRQLPNQRNYGCKFSWQIFQERHHSAIVARLDHRKQWKAKEVQGFEAKLAKV